MGAVDFVVNKRAGIPSPVRGVCTIKEYADA